MCLAVPLGLACAACGMPQHRDAALLAGAAAGAGSLAGVRKGGEAEGSAASSCEPPARQAACPLGQVECFPHARCTFSVLPFKYLKIVAFHILNVSQLLTCYF